MQGPPVPQQKSFRSITPRISRSFPFGAGNSPWKRLAAAACLIALAGSVQAANTRGGLRIEPRTTAFNPGEVIVYWTAPGDDGHTGRATGYDLRYQPASAGPIDTDQEWQRATQVTSEPTPGLPFQTDSAVVYNLDYNHGYYFCLKAYDHALNYSGMSNSPYLVAGDTIGFEYLPGDANANGLVNGIDVVYLVSYFKESGNPPAPYLAGDANGDCLVNGLDVSYLVIFFKGWGPAPVLGDCISRSAPRGPALRTGAEIKQD